MFGWWSSEQTSSLPPESGDLKPGGIGLEPVVEGQELDRDLLSGAALASQEHLPEGAGADAIEELVAVPERRIDVDAAQAIVGSMHRRGDHLGTSACSGHTTIEASNSTE
jgi:hypothetical protein